MKIHLSAVFWTGILGMAVFLDGRPATAQSEATVTVVPKQTDEILANPRMGWETFHRAADRDKNLPAWIPSTVNYTRYSWRRLEPEQGKIAFDFLDGVVRESRRAGQTLAFRVMCFSPTRGESPGWLRDAGVKILKARRDDGPVVELPDFDDPQTLAIHLDFIRRLGARYDGHPDLVHVDLGSVGWWGEWHMSGTTDAAMPTSQTQKKVIDAYLAAFRKTPVLMLIGGREMVQYAVERGAGWRADCLGSASGRSEKSSLMGFYAHTVPAYGATDAWKTAPVAWETCGVVSNWVNDGKSLRYIFNFALALHGSCLNNKSSPLPQGDDARAEIERFLRRLGYRLVLNELRHPAQVKAGDKIELAMKWQNLGSAPCYQPYRVAYRLTNDHGDEKVAVGGVTVNRWLGGSIDTSPEALSNEVEDLPPGEVYEVTDAFDVPGDLPSGDYVLSVGVVDVAMPKPVVELGIQGRDPDGWYPLSQVTITQ